MGVGDRAAGLRRRHSRATLHTLGPPRPHWPHCTVTPPSLQTPASPISPLQGPEPRTYRITGFQHWAEPQQPTGFSAEELRPSETPVHTAGANEV